MLRMLVDLIRMEEESTQNWIDPYRECCGLRELGKTVKLYVLKTQLNGCRQKTRKQDLDMHRIIRSAVRQTQATQVS